MGRRTEWLILVWVAVMACETDGSASGGGDATSGGSDVDASGPMDGAVPSGPDANASTPDGASNDSGAAALDASAPDTVTNLGALTVTQGDLAVGLQPEMRVQVQYADSSASARFDIDADAGTEVNGIFVRAANRNDQTAIEFTIRLPKATIGDYRSQAIAETEANCTVDFARASWHGAAPMGMQNVFVVGEACTIDISSGGAPLTGSFTVPSVDTTVTFALTASGIVMGEASDAGMSMDAGTLDAGQDAAPLGDAVGCTGDCGELTFRGFNWTDHESDALEAVVIRTDSNEVVVRGTTTIAGAMFSTTWPAIVARDVAHRIDWYIDADADGACTSSDVGGARSLPAGDYALGVTVQVNAGAQDPSPPCATFE